MTEIHVACELDALRRRVADLEAAAGLKDRLTIVREWRLAREERDAANERMAALETAAGPGGVKLVDALRTAEEQRDALAAAIREDREEARSACGGDGAGCAGYRERNLRCPTCPMGLAAFDELAKLRLYPEDRR